MGGLEASTLVCLSQSGDVDPPVYALSLSFFSSHFKVLIVLNAFIIQHSNEVMDPFISNSARWRPPNSLQLFSISLREKLSRVLNLTSATFMRQPTIYTAWLPTSTLATYSSPAKCQWCPCQVYRYLLQWSRVDEMFVPRLMWDRARPSHYPFDVFFPFGSSFHHPNICWWCLRRLSLPRWPFP